MKKLIYILIAIFTFSIGFWLFHLRPLVMTGSLCDISQRDAELFESKQIRIKAFLDGVSRTENDTNYYSVFNFGNGCLAGADLEISEEIKEQLKADENLKASINLMRQSREEEFDNRRNESYKPVHYIAEVEVTGEIKRYKRTDTSGWNPTQPFVIKVDKIKQVSPIRLLSFEEIQEIKKVATNLN